MFLLSSRSWRNLFLCSSTMIFVAASALAEAAQVTIAPELLTDLREQRKDLSDKMRDLDAVGKKISVAKADKRASESSIVRLKKEYDETKKQLEKMQDLDREFPGTVSPAKMKETEDSNREAFQKWSAAKDAKSEADVRVNQFSVESGVIYAEFLRVRKSFEREVDRVVEGEVQVRMERLRTKKEVTVSARVSCGPDDTIAVCKERAKKAAELKAAEQGSTSFFNSITEVKNFSLSKEELRSEVQANLSNKEFKDAKFDGESSEVTLTAQVEPVIGEKLIAQISDTVRFEVMDAVGGRIDFSKVQDPAHASSSEADSSEEEVEVVVKPKKTKRVIVQEEEEPEPPVVVRRAPPPPQPAERKAVRAPIVGF